MPPRKETFGAYLRQLRKEAALRLEDAAREIGIHGGYLGELERGTKPPPPDDKIKALAHLYQVPPDELYIRARRFPEDVLEGLWLDPDEIFELARARRAKNPDSTD